MKKRLFLIFIILTIFGCSNDDDNRNPNPSPNNCELETVISAEQYDKAPSHQLVINNLEIEKNCLKIDFSSGGCDGSTWEIKLIDSEVVLESNPPKRNLRLSLKSKELCEAFITKEVTFDISKLQVEGNKVQLNITNSDKNILYEY